MTNNSCTSPPLQTGFSFNANLRISHTFEKVLHHVKTPFQEIVLYDTSSFGKVLFIDDLPQSNEADEHVYHETMVHSAMLVHPNPKKVFIGGGGEYATAREVLRHKSVEHVDMVDLDAQVMAVSKQFLPTFHEQCYNDARLHLIVDDAKKMLELAADDTYDVIIMDLCDPMPEGRMYNDILIVVACAELYTREFYNMCKQKLTKDGVLVTQAGSTDFTFIDKVFSAVYNTLSHEFASNILPLSTFMNCVLMHYSFVVASKTIPMQVLTKDYINASIAERLVGGHANLQFYDGESHAMVSNLDKRVRAILQKETRVISKENLVFTIKE